MNILRRCLRHRGNEMGSWRVILLSGCIACGQLRQTPATSVESSPILPESKEWYRTATLRRSVRSDGPKTVRICAIVPRDSSVATSYRCDVVVLVLRPSVTVQAIGSLLADISATVERVFIGPSSVAYLRVPTGTELTAIERAYADSNVTHAGLSLERIVALP
jgi:hypothetical protein